MQNPKRYIRNAYRTPKMWTSEYFPVPKPPRERYQQIDAGPPSAIEEQRVIRALWQLFLIWELHSIVSGPSSRWDWTPSEANQLQVLHFDDIWKHSLRNDIREQIRTMADCSCLFPALSSPIERYRAAKSLAHSAQWRCQYDCPLLLHPILMIWSLLLVLQNIALCLVIFLGGTHHPPDMWSFVPTAALASQFGITSGWWGSGFCLRSQTVLECPRARGGTRPICPVGKYSERGRLGGNRA